MKAASRYAAWVFVSILAAQAGHAQTAATIDLQQGWTPQQKEQFWFTPQGSLLLPYPWFVSVKQADSDTRYFREPANMTRLGYLPRDKSTMNPGALPIGFAYDSDRDGKPFVGFTCAACHTTQLRINDQPVIVEGAPALADFWGFLNDLVDALDATAASDSKFTAFANEVLGSGHSSGDESALKAELDIRRKTLRERWLKRAPATPYGPGRLDAFGGLYNQAAAFAIDAPGNALTPDAPVSYPFLWDTPHHDKVQWNGSADNRLAGGLGPVFRNIGEALGVFGTVTVEKKTLPKYASSVNVTNLKKLERMISTLRSPVWPSQVLSVDPALVTTGKNVYQLFCVQCHAVIDPADSNRRIKAKLVDVETVGTDPRFAVNYAERFIDATRTSTGILENAPKLPPVDWSRFRKTASGGAIFSNVILGTYAGRQSSGSRDREEEPNQELVAQAIGAYRKDALAPITSVYKARPLNGVWATAPFLHNGSVPSIAELLKPAASRPQRFWVGNRNFDDRNLGLAVTQVPGAFLFDTSQPGNSNAGHEYGTTLSDDHKRALLEYLKTL